MKNERKPGKPKLPCSLEGCGAPRYPGLAWCYEHATKDALAALVEEAIRRGYRPGLLRFDEGRGPG